MLAVEVVDNQVVIKTVPNNAVAAAETGCVTYASAFNDLHVGFSPIHDGTAVPPYVWNNARGS